MEYSSPTVAPNIETSIKVLIDDQIDNAYTNYSMQLGSVNYWNEIVGKLDTVNNCIRESDLRPSRYIYLLDYKKLKWQID